MLRFFSFFWGSRGFMFRLRFSENGGENCTFWVFGCWRIGDCDF